MNESFSNKIAVMINTKVTSLRTVTFTASQMAPWTPRPWEDGTQHEMESLSQERKRIDISAQNCHNRDCPFRMGNRERSLSSSSALEMRVWRCGCWLSWVQVTESGPQVKSLLSVPCKIEVMRSTLDLPGQTVLMTRVPDSCQVPLRECLWSDWVSKDSCTNVASRSDAWQLQVEWIQKTGQGRFREPGYRALLISEEDPGEATVCHALLLLPVASPSPVCLWGDLGKPGQAAPWDLRTLFLKCLLSPSVQPLLRTPPDAYLGLTWQISPVTPSLFLFWPHQPPACAGVVQGDFSTDGKRWWCSQGLWKQECLLCECHCLGILLLLARLGLKGPEFHVKIATKGWFVSLCRDCHEWAEEPGTGHLFLYPCDHSSEMKCWVQGCGILLQWVHSQAT